MTNSNSGRRGRSTILMMLMAFCAVPAGADVSVRHVHHGENPDRAETLRLDPVQLLMSVVEQSCYERGSDLNALKAWAEHSHWAPATEAQLKAVPENEFASVVGGWTVASEYGATTIIQSQLLGPQHGQVCSVTKQLPDVGLHPGAKLAFQEKFGTTIAEEHDSPGQHIDRFWIERRREPPVRASMVFTPSQRMLTIRMIHGEARPLRS